MATSLIVNTVVVALVSAQRGLEMAISARHRRFWRQRGVDAARDPVWPLMVLVHVGLLAGSALEPWLLSRPFLAAIALPAITLFLLAQALRFWVLRSLREHWNTRILETTKVRVVTSGPYRFVRHPNYAAVLIELATLPLFHSAWLTWIAVNLLHIPVLIVRIRSEEAVLRRADDWTRAFAAKPRFLPWPVLGVCTNAGEGRSRGGSDG